MIQPAALPEKEAVQIRPDAVPPSERLLLDTQAAAEMLSVSPHTLERLPIPRVKVGRLVRWRKIDLDMYVRSLFPER